MEYGTFCANRETFGISINKDVLEANTTNCHLENRKDSMEIFSLTIRIVIGISWLIVVLIGAIGNSLVLFVIGYIKSIQTIPNWLLFNLAIADGLMTIVALPILGIFQTFYYPVWQLPNWSCYLLNCFTHIGALASGASLAAISVHRFIVIRFSRRVHITKRHLVLSLFVIWSIAIGGSVSSMMSAGVIGLIRPISGSMRLTKLCIQVNPSASKEDFQLAFRLSMYVVYSLFLFLLYSNIGYFIYTSKVPGHESTADKSEARKRQAVKMLATATAVMIISYFPYMVLVGLTLFAKPGYFSKIFAIEILCNIITGINHVINPFIYCALSSQFRQAFKKFFRRLQNKETNTFGTMSGKHQTVTKKVQCKAHMGVRKTSSLGLIKNDRSRSNNDDVNLNSLQTSNLRPTAGSTITLQSYLEESVLTASEPSSSPLSIHVPLTHLETKL